MKKHVRAKAPLSACVQVSRDTTITNNDSQRHQENCLELSFSRSLPPYPCSVHKVTFNETNEKEKNKLKAE